MSTESPIAEGEKIEHAAQDADDALTARGDTAHAAKSLLDTVSALTQELHGTVASNDITLDSHFDSDLGFDSLSRAEIIRRTESLFGVSLSVQAISNSETPRDLLREVSRATPQSQSKKLSVNADHHIDHVSLGATQNYPSGAQTLQDVLDWHNQKHPDRTHIWLYDDNEDVIEITYGELHTQAQNIAAGLLEQGLEPGQTVAIMLPTSRDYFISFIGIMLARCIPVPIYPPARPSMIEEHLQRHVAILENAQTRLLITVPEARKIAQLLRTQVQNLQGIVTVQEINLPTSGVIAGTAQSQDTAFLQYTSGSTGNPKGVILSHANLLANIRAMGQHVQVNAQDVFVSWLPLYHDMGLIGAWFTSLYHAMPLVSMSPLLFLSRPQRWLWAIHNHRGTISPAPNFAYELCLRQLNPDELAGLDLSSWRIAMNGAEPVSPSTMQRFINAFEPYGMQQKAMWPVYGLAECCVGLAFPPLDREAPLLDRIDRHALMSKSLAIPATSHEDNADVLQFFSVGHPIPKHEIRIVDELGHELPDRQQGKLQFRGPSTTSGYYRNPEATQALFSDGWIESGDLAYAANGDTFITGRVKDIIIRAGRNLYPHELEEAINQIPGIRKGCVAVFASPEPGATEKLVVVAETRETDTIKLDVMRHAISVAAQSLMDLSPDDIVLTTPYSVPKTSSGKIRRAATRDMYSNNELGRAQRKIWLQILRFVLSSIKPQLKRSWHKLQRASYAAYFVSVFALISPFTWASVAAAPDSRWGWRLTRKFSQLLLKLLGNPVRVSGLENIPVNSRCIYVANHTSYLDVILLCAHLPVDYSFVAKSELARNRFTRIFLNRIDTEFVERFDTDKSLEDARRIVNKAQDGHSLLFFPEGTFGRSAGLRGFHMGAFVAAIDAQMPLVPISIKGARSILRDDSMFAHRGALEMIISPAIAASGKDWKASVELRNKTRAAILSECGEPDLGKDQ